MAGAAFWKGYLKLSLVTCRVAMQPAITGAEKIRFHTLNRATGNRVESRWIDSVTSAPVEPDQRATAYERGDNDFLILEDDELARVRLPSTRTIDIDRFIPAGSVPWVYYDTPHYLTPDDAVSTEAFAVIRAAMEDTGTAGLSRVVLYRRERAVLLLPRARGIIAWTLRYGPEIRPDPIEGHPPEARPDAAAKRLAEQLIAARTGDWSADLLRDPVEEKLHEILAAKSRRAPKPRDAEPRPAESGKVVNIMDALKRSLASEKRSRS